MSISVLCVLFIFSIFHVSCDTIYFTTTSPSPKVYSFNLNSNTTSSLYTSQNDINGLVADSTYLYFGVSQSIVRINHQTGEVNDPWVLTNQTQFGNGLIENIFLDTTNNVLYYQTSDFNLYILHPKTMQVTNYGQFGNSTIGGMAGQLFIFNSPKGQYMFYGEDTNRNNKCTGIMRVDITKGDKEAFNFYCGSDSLRHPRGIIVYDNVLYFDDSYDNQLTMLDAYSGDYKGTIYMPTVANVFSLDVSSGVIYFSDPWKSQAVIYSLDLQTQQSSIVYASDYAGVVSTAFVKG